MHQSNDFENHWLVWTSGWPRFGFWSMTGFNWQLIDWLKEQDNIQPQILYQFFNKKIHRQSTYEHLTDRRHKFLHYVPNATMFGVRIQVLAWGPLLHAISHFLWPLSCPPTDKWRPLAPKKTLKNNKKYKKVSNKANSIQHELKTSTI